MRVHIDCVRCFSAVGSTRPGRAAASKGGGVHPSKSHVSWVKYGASQYGLYLLKVSVICGENALSTKGTVHCGLWCIGCG